MPQLLMQVSKKISERKMPNQLKKQQLRPNHRVFLIFKISKTISILYLKKMNPRKIHQEIYNNRISP